jgi:hypothetical protein|tara:strand:- start:18484 stop:18696 length:213 start_codon:yes stop_codon:yes gene_type:complete
MNGDRLGELVTEIHTDIKWMKSKQEAYEALDKETNTRLKSLESSRAKARGGSAVIGGLGALAGLYKYFGG